MSCCPWGGRKSKFKAPNDYELQHMEEDPFIASPLVAELDPDVFQKFLNRKGATLVMFYNPNKKESKSSAKQFAKAAQKTERMDHAYAGVNCVIHYEFCLKQSIDLLPSFKLYNWGTLLSHFRDYQLYKFDNMKKWVESVPADCVDTGSDIYTPSLFSSSSNVSSRDSQAWSSVGGSPIIFNSPDSNQ